MLAIIRSSHYVARIDLNLAYMVRVLASRYSLANEQLLISLFQASHGFTGVQSVLIQRDIVLILANWKRRYWLSDLKNSFATLQPWVKRAFLISSYSLGDEGDHWRKAIKSSLGGFDGVIRTWAAKRSGSPDWRIPV